MEGKIAPVGDFCVTATPVLDIILSCSIFISSRKAIKATVVLLPLLGLTNLLFFMKPGESTGIKTAYHVTNAVLHSSQVS